MRNVRRILSLLLVLAALFGAEPAFAQEAAPAAPAADPAAVSSLIQTIEDDAQRAKLIEQLRLLTQAQGDQSGALMKDGLGAELLSLISQRVEAISDVLAEAGQAIYKAPEALRWASRQTADPIARGRWIETAVKVLVVLGLAMAVEFGANRFLARARRRLAEQPRNGWATRALAIMVRSVLELLPILVFAAAAYGILPLTEPREATRLIVLTLVNASVLARIVLAFGRIVLSPGFPKLRPLPLGDETANYAHIWLRRLVNVAVYGYFLAQGLLLIGVPPALYLVLLRAVGLLLAAMVIVLILQNRATVAQWLGGSTARQPGARVRIADIWHLMAIALVVALFVVWAFAIPGGISFLLRAIVATAVILGIARLITLAIVKALRRGFALNPELNRRYPGLEARANRHLPILQKALTSVVWLLAGLMLLEAWGVDAFGWLASDVGRRLTGSIVSILLVIAFVWLAWELIDTAIERYLEERGPDGALVERSARTRTLLPLLRNAARIVLAAMALLIVLSELGLNIGPLLAGAGVVGLAIGFGAQTLVKDVITGIFILVEESMSVGDVVDLEGHSGVIESMTIRSVRIRDGSGSVHTIPFSAVSTIVNMTKEYAYAVFFVGIAYESDVDRASAAIQDVGRSLQQDPAFAPAILSPIEVLGVDSFGDFSVKLQARIKTRPGKQWAVSREFNRRIMQSLARAEIEIPHHPLPPPSPRIPRPQPQLAEATA